MKIKWIAILLLLFSLNWFGCSRVEWSVNTGQVNIAASSHDKAGAETFNSTTTFQAIDHKTTVHLWAMAKDIGGGAIDTLAWFGGKLGLLPGG